MNYKKVPIYIILPIILSVVLTGCSENVKNNDTESDKKIDASDNSIYKNSVQESSQRISIGPGCIGCGLCVRVDREHFDMDENQRLAVVKSQDNKNSQQLKLAIRNCPPRVISLN